MAVVADTETMKVYLIRHAESMNNIIMEGNPENYQALRSHDPLLSPNGIQQTKSLATYFKTHEFKFDLLICSAMTRSMQTTQIIADELNVPVNVQADIHEVKGCHSCGVVYPGKNIEEIKEMFPTFTITKGVTENGWWHKDCIETYPEAHERAQQLWEQIFQMQDSQEYAGKTIGIVTHGLFLDFLFGALMKREICSQPRFAFYNTGYSLIEMQKPTPVILYLNRIEHLSVMPLLFHRGIIN